MLSEVGLDLLLPLNGTVKLLLWNLLLCGQSVRKDHHALARKEGEHAVVHALIARSQLIDSVPKVVGSRYTKCISQLGEAINPSIRLPIEQILAGATFFPPDVLSFANACRGTAGYCPELAVNPAFAAAWRT